MELDPTPFADELEKRTSEVKAAEARRDAAKEKRNAAKKANGYGVSSANELEDKLTEAEAALQLSRRAETIAKRNLALAKVKAPIDGVVKQIVPLTIGKLVASDSKEPWATIVSMDPMCVCFSVDQNSVLRLRRRDAGGEREGRPNRSH